MQSLNKRNVAIVSLIAVLALAGILFGITGIRVILGMIILFFVPSYLILRNFSIDEDELMFFSFFLGFGLFPVIVFYVNKFVGSLRLSVLVTFVVLVVVGITLSLIQKKKTKIS